MRIAARHHGVPARAGRVLLRRLGLAMVLLLAMAQVGAAAHFVLVPHALSPGKGVLVHCEDGDPPGPEKHAPTDTRHQSCGIFAVLCQASNVAGPAASIKAPHIVVHEWAYVSPDRGVIKAWPIFMLAPAQSPPAGPV